MEQGKLLPKDMILKGTFMWPKSIEVPITYTFIFLKKHEKSGKRTSQAGNL